MRTRQVSVFLVRRILALVILLLLISFLVFGLLYLAPGNAIQVLLGTHPSSPAIIAALKAKYHLNDSFIGQYLLWLKGAVHLNLGISIQTGQTVTSLIASRIGLTVFLGIYAFLISVLLGVPAGVIAAMRNRSVADRAIVGVSLLGVSVPAFVSGIFLLYLLAIDVGWFPVYGPGGGFVDRLWHLTLPAFALAFGVMALILKLTRASMITVLEQDYIAFAQARGVGPVRVIVRYALRNALGPIITAGGLILGVVITGAVLVEQVFALPGIGTLLITSVEAKDVPVVQGFTLLAAAILIAANFLIDLCYLFIDPRITAGRGAQ
jgi:peptide/nickel transport system permease protein